MLVCPGVYREIVFSAGRDGLTIRALEAHRAVIQQPPGQRVRDRSALVMIADARLEGFRIRPAPGAGCAPVAAMVLVYGTATVRGNRIVGSPPFQKDCGLYEDAVIHNSRGPGGTFELMVAANVIRDFRSAGVAFETELTPVNATIRRNVFARAHGEPASLKQRGYAVWTGFASATVHVMRNLIRTAPGVRRMKKGIYSIDSVDSSIRANIISGVDQGIVVYGFSGRRRQRATGRNRYGHEDGLRPGDRTQPGPRVRARHRTQLDGRYGQGQRLPRQSALGLRRPQHRRWDRWNEQHVDRQPGAHVAAGRDLPAGAVDGS